MGFLTNIWGFLQRAWTIAVHEPKKLMHCLKVGLALSLVSLFYYMRPLYQGVGGNAMWAVMTVVVVSEYTVGATLSKSVNRATGTFLAGALAVGVHWVATQSGEKLEPIILQASVFLLAAAATFSRFIPSIKARFDYGAMIFILTFSLVSVSGYRVQKLFKLAHDRLSTIAIGTSICILISMLVCPVWAGTELHNLIKTIWKSFQIPWMANFARWEPAHGGFNFGHPWKEYLNVGASLRSCAYCVEALNGSSICSDAKVPDFLKAHFSKFCKRLSASSSAVMKELAVAIRDSVNDIGEGNASSAVVTLAEIVPLVTVTSLLIEIAARTEKIAEAVNGLADKAEFRVESAEKTKKSQSQKVKQISAKDEDDKTMMTLEKDSVQAIELVWDRQHVLQHEKSKGS
ncbi:UNVERIFIED_CONTAM: Aluminum-activated malate transporter 10 [Sesamum angustifolium]|uniref:Aluminum-activated malate transporter 10 n=1 Tax=Sesamum angustifolium TaxID=2727405 RepID=A0AAW2RIS7_9LAMI